MAYQWGFIEIFLEDKTILKQYLFVIGNGISNQSSNSE